jgi:hypothetical protein
MARTHNEELISLKGHITGIRREIKILGTSVYKLRKETRNTILVYPLWTRCFIMALLLLFLAK